MKIPTHAALSCLLLIGLACASPSPSNHLERLYGELREDVSERKIGARGDQAWIERQHARLETVHAMLAKGEVKTALDHLYAAVILVETDDPRDLVTAQAEALSAAELGENRGFRVAAEAIDKQRVKLGALQKYGTQYVYEPVLKAWKLYPFDPATSDVERQAMGVEPLAKLKEREALLNEMTGGKPN